MTRQELKRVVALLEKTFKESDIRVPKNSGEVWELAAEIIEAIDALRRADDEDDDLPF